MSYFTTKAFSFSLPGPWEEKTVNVHQRPDEKASLVLTRSQREADGRVDLIGAIDGLPSSPQVERELLHDRRVQIGPLSGQDIGVINRTRAMAEYHRIVCLAWYDVDLSFQWGGAASAQNEVDARADHALSTLRFFQRG